MNYDVILLAGFGGPRQLADVVPFLRNVTAGKAIPDARLEQVGAHYRLFDGHSPINEQTEALRDALLQDQPDIGAVFPEGAFPAARVAGGDMLKPADVVQAALCGKPLVTVNPARAAIV